MPAEVLSPLYTGVKYLSARSAGYLDPRKHGRIRKIYADGWHEYVAYLMPDPNLATEVRENYRWLDLFDQPNNDGIPSERIASAKKVILEAYDLYDKLLEQRLVYDRETEEVTEESLHNWPFHF